MELLPRPGQDPKGWGGARGRAEQGFPWAGEKKGGEALQEEERTQDPVFFIKKVARIIKL